MEPSREARELSAARVLAQDADVWRTAAAGEPSPLVAWPDASTCAHDALALHATEPGRAMVFAEAHVTAATRRARGAYSAAWRAASVTLRGESTPVALGVLDATVMTETSAARREGLCVAADVAVRDLRGDARTGVETLRNALSVLTPEIQSALGIAGTEANANAVLSATEDVYRELDPWACRALGIDRARLTWAMRLRSLAAPTLPALIPPGTWASVASRWLSRVDLEPLLRRVSDDLRPAGRAAAGVSVVETDPGAHAVLVGRPTNAGCGAMEVAGAVGEALARISGRGHTPGVRRGADAAVYGLARALGRGLYLERHFLRREAGLDVVPRQRAMLEALHAEVLRMRVEAAYAVFTALALARAPDLAGLYVAWLTRAVGCAPSPAWAPHTVLRAASPAGLWGARVTGTLAEPTLVNWLRERYDEDWFRNPRTGLGLTDALQDARTVGVGAWQKSVGGGSAETVETELARRVAEALRDARRTTV